MDDWEGARHQRAERRQLLELRVEGINTYFRRSSDNGRGGAERSKILRTQLRGYQHVRRGAAAFVNDLDARYVPMFDVQGKRPSHHDDHPLQRGELARHRNHRRADTGLQAASQRRRHAALRDRGVALAILSCAKRETARPFVSIGADALAIYCAHEENQT